MKFFSFHYAITALSSLVWLINGLYCKVLNLVPRHQQIVSEILGNNHAVLLTKLIGFGEIFTGIWILSGVKPRYCVLFQIVLVALMNTIEFITVPQLLLFGRFNIIVAAMFITVIYVNETRWKADDKKSIFLE